MKILNLSTVASVPDPGSNQEQGYYPPFNRSGYTMELETYGVRVSHENGKSVVIPFANIKCWTPAPEQKVRKTAPKNESEKEAQS